MIHIDSYGDPANPAILMLHGAAAVDTFAGQYGFADRYHLVVPHLYGSGLETDTVYAPSRQIDALMEVLDSLGPDKIRLVGHSLGGELAFALTCLYPKRFSRAAFLSSWLCASEKSVARYVRYAKSSVPMLKWRALVRFQGKYWHYTDAQADFMADYSTKITSESYEAWFKARIHLDDYPQYASLELPMLAVCGARETAEMRHSIFELGARNQNCRVVVLPGANHDFPMRRPDLLNPLLLDFFAGR